MSVRIRGTIATPGAAPADGVVEVDDDGMIVSVARDRRRTDFDASGLLIVPGFVDLHVHGGGGADFMAGDVASVRTVAATHARFGTTTLLATTLTAERVDIDRCIDAVRTAMDDPGATEARIAGIHLEGPYICAAKRGAQPPGPIRPPDWGELSRWIDRARGGIKCITIAPEVDGAIDFVRLAADAGVLVSIGHTSATYAQTIAALDAGASHATHLFNAMPALGHREPGAAGALLTDPRAFVEIIADGVHLHSGAVALAVRAQGWERTMLITDAIAGADMPDGCYPLGGRDVFVSAGKARFDDGTLAGSVLTMNRAFCNVMAMSGVDASCASAMAAANAAGRLGLSESIGRIAPGFRADLALMDPESGAVAATMRDGKWIWRA